MIKRLFDILFSVFGIIFLSPLFLIISFIIILDSRGGIFYFQNRVGKNNRNFKLIKFRSMFVKSEDQGLITIGDKDSRITKVGIWLRKFKIDELPQLINILRGDMSFVGPRPEVRKYVNLYNEQQKKVLNVQPGLTDYASIEYMGENELLSRFNDPEKVYIEKIMPAKLELNLKYIREKSFITDLKIIYKTLASVFNSSTLSR